MTDRPILMSAPMVKAILAGTKTQTRRVVHNPHRNDGGFVLQDYGTGFWPYRSHDGESGCYLDRQKDGDYFSEAPLRCPYGQPGDRLWVREAWRAMREFDGDKPSDLPWRTPVVYEASLHPDTRFGKLRPGMFMPRWASRITLGVTGVWVERLQDISEADALAEGITHRTINDPRVEYRHLWESINGPGSWELNAWVWVVEFKRVTPC